MPRPRITLGALKPAAAVAAGFVLLAGAFLWFGEAIERFHDRVALAGRTMDRTPVAIGIGEVTLAIPANMIRSPQARRAGPAERVDLLLHWPDLDGFSESNAESFRSMEPTAPLVFVTVLRRDTDHGTTGWLDRLYARYFSDDAWAGPNGLVGVRLDKDSGYAGEELFFQPESRAPFVARCTPDGNPEMPATCLREILVGDALIARYRFNKNLLGAWEALDPAIRARVAGFLPRGAPIPDRRRGSPS